MDIIIRTAVPEDVSGMLRMMERFADFVHLRSYLTVTEGDLAEAAFGRDAFVRMLAAFEHECLVGYAIYYPHFSSFRGERGFYLEDIFVDEKHRGRGVGLMFLKKIAREGARLGFCRIDFQVMKDNAGAIGFYRAHGAEANEDEIHFKFAGEAFAKFSNGGPDL